MLNATLTLIVENRLLLEYANRQLSAEFVGSVLITKHEGKRWGGLIIAFSVIYCVKPHLKLKTEMDSIWR